MGGGWEVGKCLTERRVVTQIKVGSNTQWEVIHSGKCVTERGVDQSATSALSWPCTGSG